MLIAWEACGDPQVHFLEKVYIPFVVSASVGQTLQKTVDYPQLQFLDKVFIPVVVVSGADGQTVQKTVEYPQLQFLDKVFFPSCFWCRWPDSAENCGVSTVAVPGQDTDHVLSVVGRGEDASQGRYWIVRYSWGEYCDELSYVRVVFGALNVESQCS